MMTRQLSSANGVGDSHRQGLEVVGDERFEEIVRRLKFSQRLLDANFPGRRRTHIYCIGRVADSRAGVNLKGLVIR